MIFGEKRHEETGQEKQPEGANKNHPPNKTPLLSDRREDVIIVDGGGGKKPEFDLSVGSLEPFARKTAGADGNKRLVDCPRRASRIDLGMRKGGEPILLVGLQSKVRGQGQRRCDNEQYANQIAQRYSTDEEQC